MGYNVVFSEEAIETFESIGQQILVRWGEKEVNEFRKRAYKVTEIISKFPLIFQQIHKENIRKAFIHKNCSMFYKIGDTYIEILFFWDNRQEPML